MSKNEKKEGKFLYGKEQIDSIRERINADSGRIMAEINAVTPIFVVKFITNDDKKVHFANFYGTTIESEKGASQAEVEAKVQKNDVKILKMLEELEEKIKSGGFDKIKQDLLVEINWAQFGGFMHKMNAEMEDVLSCKNVKSAYNKFIREYADCNKTEKEILDERLEQFEKSLNYFSKFFLED